MNNIKILDNINSQTLLVILLSIIIIGCQGVKVKNMTKKQNKLFEFLKVCNPDKKEFIKKIQEFIKKEKFDDESLEEDLKQKNLLDSEIFNYAKKIKYKMEIKELKKIFNDIQNFVTNFHIDKKKIEEKEEEEINKNQKVKQVLNLENLKFKYIYSHSKTVLKIKSNTYKFKGSSLLYVERIRSLGTWIYLWNERLHNPLLESIMLNFIDVKNESIQLKHKYHEKIKYTKYPTINCYPLIKEVISNTYKESVKQIQNKISKNSCYSKIIHSLLNFIYNSYTSTKTIGPKLALTTINIYQYYLKLKIDEESNQIIKKYYRAVLKGISAITKNGMHTFFLKVSDSLYFAFFYNYDEQQSHGEKIRFKFAIDICNNTNNTKVQNYIDKILREDIKSQSVYLKQNNFQSFYYYNAPLYFPSYISHKDAQKHRKEIFEKKLTDAQQYDKIPFLSFPQGKQEIIFISKNNQNIKKRFILYTEFKNNQYLVKYIWEHNLKKLLLIFTYICPRILIDDSIEYDNKTNTLIFKKYYMLESKNS